MTGGRLPLEAFARTLGITLGHTEVERIDEFLDLLVRWNRRWRLTGDRDRSLLMSKHVADSLAPARLIGDGEMVVDLGSGAGFPGLVLGCVRPGSRFVLVDSRSRACSFLEYAAGALRLDNIRVIRIRMEELDATGQGRGGCIEPASVVTSRAVPASTVFPVARRVLRHAGRLIFMASGDQSRGELERAARKEGLEAIGEVLEYDLPTGERRRLIQFRRP